MLTRPVVTVAAVIEQDGRFLLVEERIGARLVLNQPAGHLEPDESLVDAVIRETREETGWTLIPQGVVGVYRWPHPSEQKTYVRVCFHGTVTQHDVAQPLDAGIERAVWLDRNSLADCAADTRSPLVLRCIDDFLRGKRFPLELLVEVP